MDFQKYLKYKTKYLQLKKKFLQKGGNGRIKVKVQRVGIVPDESRDRYTFDIMLWDTEAPEELKRNSFISEERKGYVTWANFKNNESIPLPLYSDYKSYTQCSPQNMQDCKEYLDKMKGIHLELLKRAWTLTKQNKQYMLIGSLDQSTPLVFEGERLLTDPSLGPPLIIPA